MHDPPTIDLLGPNGFTSLAVAPASASVLTLLRDPTGSPVVTARPEPSPPLWLVGEVDLVTGPDLVEQVHAALVDRPEGPVVLDLSRVTFLDLVGLRMLVRLQAELSTGGRQVALRAPSAPVRLLLRVVGSTSTLPPVS